MNHSMQEEAIALKEKTRSSTLGMALLLGMLAAFGPLSIDMYLPALPNLADDLHASTSLVQLSLTACLLGIAAGQLFAGPISDLRGSKGPLLIGLLTYAIASLLCVFFGILHNVEYYLCELFRVAKHGEFTRNV